MSRDEIILGLSKFKKSNTEKYGIKSLGLFGSIARNNYSDQSDIDIVVELKTPDIFIMADIKHDIEDCFNRHVDIVRKREKMNPLLKTKISNEAIYV